MNSYLCRRKPSSTTWHQKTRLKVQRWLENSSETSSVAGKPLNQVTGAPISSSLFFVLLPFLNSRGPSALLPCFSATSPIGNQMGTILYPLAVFDENSRRIEEVILKKKAKKNPSLIVACAVDALCDFTECVQSNKHGVLPDSIDGSSVISMEKEIREFVCEGWSEAIMKQKFVELSDIADLCNGCGVIVNYGDSKVFVNGGLGDSVRYVVDKLSKLVEIYGEKLWLIGAVGDYETYMEFVAQFALVDKNWDLQLLPVISSKSINEGSYSKIRLVGLN